jgi:hypothetical protein
MQNCCCCCCYCHFHCFKLILQDHIARLFRVVCDEFRGCFAAVAFSIIEDHNSARNVGGNVAPFERAFETTAIVI